MIMQSVLNSLRTAYFQDAHKNTTRSPVIFTLRRSVISVIQKMQQIKSSPLGSLMIPKTEVLGM